ncbi:methionine ABC transporter permease [Mesotoga sp. UBA6090]|uniref:methionine ABC transporter permease n=1 Tax=Mesotoga sp. UBA6090 TaxID=1946860 RepID=UPI0025D13969|nr:methionine ABC transporter permease [Mesotoga sp. UBA6090]
MFSQIFKATLETLYMLLLSGFLSTLFGIPLGVGLYLCSRSRRLKTLYALLDLLVNIFRSIPFIILVLLLIPVTKNVMGTIIGPNAAIFNLTIAAMPFMARLSENSFNAVPSGIIDSSNSMGLNKWQMVTKVLIPETLPDQIGNITVLLINLVTYTAIAGAVGAGGLGQLAINYGYYRFQWDVVLYAVIVLVAISQLLQFTGGKLAKGLRK